jgi:hypothetical protein
LNRFNTSLSSSDSEFSTLGASDWRKIRELVDRAVNDRDQKKIAKLNQTIHHLSVRATLAEHENKSLREAIVSERMRRKRGKYLLLEEPEEYHGGAVFWSPRKVKEAHDRQQLKEREEEQLQQQKAEANRQREDSRQAKAEAVQARRQAKVEARISREMEKADRAAKQASRAAARRTHQRLKQALKTSQKGKKRSLKAPAKASSKKRAIVRSTAGGEA